MDLKWPKLKVLPKSKLNLKIFPKNSKHYFENSRILTKLKQKINFWRFQKPVNVQKVAIKGAGLGPLMGAVSAQTYLERSETKIN